MKRKGFTLIELLAVIVVLAIIALIATPIVMNTIKNAKKGAAERTADNYIKQVETTVAESRIDGTKIPNGTYNIQPDGNLCPTSGCGENDKDKITIDMSGTKPTSGTVTISNGEVSSTDTTMTVGDYDVKYNQEKGKYESTEKGNTSVTYKNGQEVYFNVDNGTKCTSSEAVSTTRTNSGCMKFYAFNDNGGDTVNLILDHNTTATVEWNSSKSSVNGPTELLAQLKQDTAFWEGTETPSNYTMDQSTQDSRAKYTIDYSGYKARLITAQEIAQITGNTSWNERVAANSMFYYLDTNTTTASTTCTFGKTSGCNYGWLYDRTYTSCTTYGCLNNSDSLMTGKGYWTASSRADNSYYAWYLSYFSLVSNNAVSSSNAYGVRPVIEVLKSKLS